MSNQDEFEASIYNVECVYADIRKQLERVGTAIGDLDPFKVVVELAEVNSLVRDCMRHAIEAQEVKIQDHVAEMRKFA